MHFCNWTHDGLNTTHRKTNIHFVGILSNKTITKRWKNFNLQFKYGQKRCIKCGQNMSNYPEKIVCKFTFGLGVFKF